MSLAKEPLVVGILESVRGLIPGTYKNSSSDTTALSSDYYFVNTEQNKVKVLITS